MKTLGVALGTCVAVALGAACYPYFSAVAALLQWLLGIVRTNYVLQGLLGSMCMTSVHMLLRDGVALCAEAAVALLCTRMSVPHTSAPREYLAVQTFVTRSLRGNITGNSVITVAAYNESGDTQFARAALHARLPHCLTVNGQKLFVVHDAERRGYYLYVFGTSQFCALRACLDAMLKSAEGAETGFVAMMLDDNLRWVPQRTVHARAAATLFVDEAEKQRLLDDMRKFFGARAEYERLGKPWRRSHWYTGTPGTGKSTFAIVAASELRLPLCMLTMSNAKLNDSTLCAALCAAPSPGIILLEDLDCIGLNVKARQKPYSKAADASGSIANVKQAAKCGVTMSGLLNAFDSACAHVGHIVLCTTNLENTIDAAVCRPGRLGDVKVRFCAIFGSRERAAMVQHYFPELDATGVVRLVTLFGDDSPACIESKCMAVAPFYKHLSDAAQIAALLRLRDTPRNAVTRSLVYQCWRVGALELWPDLLRHLTSEFASNFMLVSNDTALKDVNLLWRCKRLPDQFAFGDIDMTDVGKSVRSVLTGMLCPCSAEQQSRLTAAVQASDVSFAVWRTVLLNNLDDFEAGFAELMPSLTFPDWALKYTTRPVQWEEIAPFAFIATWGELQEMCAVLRKHCRGVGIRPSEYEAVRATLAPGSTDHACITRWINCGPMINSYSTIRSLDRSRIAHYLAFTKGLEPAECWRLARRMCPRVRTLISDIWFLHFLSVYGSAEEAIAACLQWEVEYACEFML